MILGTFTIEDVRVIARVIGVLLFAFAVYYFFKSVDKKDRELLDFLERYRDDKNTWN